MRAVIFVLLAAANLAGRTCSANGPTEDDQSGVPKTNEAKQAESQRRHAEF